MALWILIALTVALALFFVGAWYVRGPDLSLFDGVDHDTPPLHRQRFSTGDTQNDEHRAVITSLGGITTTLKGTPRRKHLAVLREEGLDSCAQECWAVYPKTIGDFLGLPPERMLFTGMAIGHANPEHPVNQLRTDRAPVADFAAFHGC